MNRESQLIEKNNLLQKNLNTENKKFYSDFVVYTRLSSFSRDNTLIEEMLLNILEDILTAQNDGLSARTYFGQNPKTVADDLLKAIPTSPSEMMKVLACIVGGFTFSSILPALSSLNGQIDLGSILLDDLYSIFLVFAATHLLARSVYTIYQSPINRYLQVFGYWILASIVVAPIFFLLILVKTPLVLKTDGLFGFSFIFIIIFASMLFWLLSNNQRFYFPYFFAALIFSLFALAIRIPWVQQLIKHSPYGHLTYIISLILAFIAYQLTNYYALKK